MEKSVCSHQCVGSWEIGRQVSTGGPMAAREIHGSWSARHVDGPKCILPASRLRLDCTLRLDRRGSCQVLGTAMARARPRSAEAVDAFRRG
jgi:hypothetical protein